MDVTVLVIFAFVYAGMMLGRYPGLGLDRTGVALLGAIALLATGRIGSEAAWQAVDVLHHSAALRPDGGLGAVPPRRASMPAWRAGSAAARVSPPALLAL